MPPTRSRQQTKRRSASSSEMVQWNVARKGIRVGRGTVPETVARRFLVGERIAVSLQLGLGAVSGLCMREGFATRLKSFRHFFAASCLLTDVARARPWPNTFLNRFLLLIRNQVPVALHHIFRLMTDPSVNDALVDADRGGIGAE